MTNLKLNLKLLFIILFMVSFQTTNAQYKYTFKDLTFETPVELKKWNKNESTFDRYNEYFEILIDHLDHEDYPTSDLAMQLCFEIIGDEELSSIKVKNGINDISNSFHIIGYDVYDDVKVPVIAGVILDSKNKIGYEIFIYCEGISEEDGLEILNSFRFIKK